MIKISELPRQDILDETTIIPVSMTDTADSDTYGVELQALRQQLNYGNAFSSIAEGLAASSINGIFFVSESADKDYVLGYSNQGNMAVPVLGSDGNPLRVPTQKRITQTTALLDANGADKILTTGGTSTQVELDKLNTTNASNLRSVGNTATYRGSSFGTFGVLTGFGSDSGNYYGSQGICVDPQNRKIYALILSGTTDGDYATINEFPLDNLSKNIPATTHTTPASYNIGHQGLTFEPLEDDFRLWTTAFRNSSDPTVLTTGRDAARFSYTSGGAIPVPQIYRLFGPEFVDSTSCTPAIDPTGVFLIAHGTKRGGNVSDSYFHVFLLKDLIAGGPGDYSTKYIKEISTQGLVDSSFPLQGLATDGEVIVATSGGSSLSGKRLYSYDINTGRLLCNDNSFTVGLSQATTDAGTFEPEGLCFFKNGTGYSLIYQIITGPTGSRNTRLYIVDNPREYFYRGIMIPWDSNDKSSNGNVYSGQYTPIITGIDNVASSTAYLCWYQCVGNMVTVSGRVDVTPTATATVTHWSLDLPRASNIAYAYQVAGHAISNSAASQIHASIFGLSTTDQAEFRVPALTAVTTFYFTFTYYVQS